MEHHRYLIQKPQNKFNLMIIAPKNVSGNFNSHKIGTKQIDFIMFTPIIQQALCHSTVQSFDEVCHSDHRSLVLDIKTDYFKHQKHRNDKMRALIINTPSQVKRYKQEVYNRIQSGQFKSKVQLLCGKLKNDKNGERHYVN